MTWDADVAVIGAGVAGSTTALGLARGGASTVLIDRAPFPREKACGEGLMPHGLRALTDLGIDPPGRPFHGIRYAIGDTVADGSFPDGHVGRGVRRNELDAILVAACRDEPHLSVMSQTHVRGLGRVPGGIRLDLGDRVLRCRAVVGADGLHSKVRRWLGLDRASRARPRFGARQHVRLRRGLPEGDRVEVHVLPQAGVELYLTPTGPGELNVALLLEKSEMGALRGDVAAGMAHWIRACPAVAERLQGSEPLSQALAVGPLRQQALRGVADRALLVGDAAGFLDAITGEGMSLGLLQAGLAAEVLGDCLKRDRLRVADLAPYDARRLAAARDLTAMTQLILWGIRNRWLARRTVRHLERHPELFSQVLAVNIGQAPLTSIGARGLRKLLVGR